MHIRNLKNFFLTFLGFRNIFLPRKGFFAVLGLLAPGLPPETVSLILTGFSIFVKDGILIKMAILHHGGQMHQPLHSLLKQIA